MDPHLISAVLSPEDQQAINEAIETLRQKLPFLIDLSAAARASMPKSGGKTDAFVRKALEICNEHPQMFPDAFLDELRKDAQLHQALSPILLAIKTLAKRLDDTSMQLNAEAYAAARTVYAVTKTPFAKAALRTASDDLGKYWIRRRKSETSEALAEPTTAPATSPA